MEETKLATILLIILVIVLSISTILFMSGYVNQSRTVKQQQLQLKEQDTQLEILRIANYANNVETRQFIIDNCSTISEANLLVDFNNTLELNQYAIIQEGFSAQILYISLDNTNTTFARIDKFTESEIPSLITSIQNKSYTNKYEIKTFEELLKLKLQQRNLEQRIYTICD